MKSTLKLISKCIILCVFLYMTPFMKGLQNSFKNTSDLLHTFVYNQNRIQSTLSLKESLNVLSYNTNLTIPEDEVVVETTQDYAGSGFVPKAEEPVEEDDNKQAGTGKRVYIYDTHQDEGYVGGNTVLDAAAILAAKLEDKGVKVILETNDFTKYRDSQNLTYNESYVVSYKFLNDALITYGEFDLCIDLHRDSIPKEASYITKDGKTYAKSMMVVGGLGKKAEDVKALSTTLTDTINNKLDGIMRDVMVREAYFNQEVSDNIVLMEVGGDVNSFEEVKNSLDVIADGIYDVLVKE